MEYHVILLYIRLGSQYYGKNDTNCFIFANIKFERCKIIIMANVSLHRSPPAMGIVLKKIKKIRGIIEYLESVTGTFVGELSPMVGREVPFSATNRYLCIKWIVTSFRNMSSYC